MINPSHISLTCHNGHSRFYKLGVLETIECKVENCNSLINPSRVTRGTHPHIVLTSNEFQEDSGYIRTFTVVPLTSKTTFTGLPDVYPINKTAKNGLTRKSYALIHQLCTVDGNCFKDSSQNWLPRIGQLNKQDKDGINKRLRYYLGLAPNPTEDWFRKNATPEMIQTVYGQLTQEEKKSLLEKLLDELE